MKAPIIGKKVNDAAIDSLIDLLEAHAEDSDVFYVGYPVAASYNAAIAIPALLISKKFGLVCFDIAPSANINDLEALRAKQRAIVLALKSKLFQNPELAGDDDLAFKVNVVTFSQVTDHNDALKSNRIVDATDLPEVLSKCSPFEEKYLKALNASIERMANIGVKAKREIAKTPNSKGSILKKIESEIANLDAYQKSAAIETPDGPQRIRGLAGSGKTIVLALKAAYLHGEHPDWKIGITFHTRALKQQLKTLIQKFYYEDYREDVDEASLSIIHSFGSLNEKGIYSEICAAYGIAPRDFGYAKRTYGYSLAFQGICSELLAEVEKEPKILFDALLIDEAQDMPKEFLRLAYLCTRNHRIVWAYDDLQNLGGYQMRSLQETFGVDPSGNSLVKLENRPKLPKQDIILPKCYRNTPWALVTAHALGSGIYRAGGNNLVQHPDDPILWQEIGYEVESGDLELGHNVVLKRSAESSPSYFNDLLNSNDAVRFIQFDEEREQFSAVAKMIKEDLTTGELYPHDIAVVFPDAINAEVKGNNFSQFLSDEGINSHMVGVTSSRDAFISEGRVALSGPYRAKGNEAPVVYVMGAEYCASGSELIKKRNILFTAITRSRGWVIVCGHGDGMGTLTAEFETLKEKGFNLSFQIPTSEQLKKMRTLYRDITATDRKKAAGLKMAFEGLGDEDAHAVLQALPKELREKLQRTLSGLDD